MHPEVFHLHVNGEQRGPYTIRQIDHQLNAGLIGEETLYWREGMEQWQPVTNLVAVRSQPPSPRRWVGRAIAAAILIVLAFLARLFGPIAVVGWRETAQYDFTSHAAYWRARDMVRHQGLPPGTVINFSPAAESPVEMVDTPPGAQVSISTEAAGAKASWRVVMSYDPQRREWTGKSVRPAKP